MTATPAGNGSTPWDLGALVSQLHGARDDWRRRYQRQRESGGREFPSRVALRGIVESLCAALFPMRLGPPDLQQDHEDYFVGHTLDIALRGLLEQVRIELRHAGGALDAEREAARIVSRFAASLPGIRVTLDSDVEAAFRGDPAARSVDEVLLCYPGLLAIIHHRLGHELYLLGVPLLARMVAELAHSATGIDIHPGAEIGASFFIDHGTGVVIGETAIIGQRVRIYQAVTLGAKRFPVGSDGELQKGLPRHPVVEDDVVIYAGATILGRVTIGRGSVIGGNVWLTHGVPPDSHVTQADAAQGGKLD